MPLPKPVTPILRFAPSPTGALHLGGLRTALFNHLFARKHGGKWILRIEDTDLTRFVHGSVDGIRKSLEWAGLDYDYGPGVGGPHGPYFQSERLDLYHEYAKKLLERGHAYRCFCGRSQLGIIRESLRKRGSNSTYDKRCLHLSEEEVHRRMKAGEKYVVRLDDQSVPRRQTPPDLIFGNLRDAHESLPTDPVLLKADLYPTYHLASVVDDHEMGITHVLRGEEWLPSLPLHLDLYSSLNLPPPQFAHLPLLLNKDGSKMSKRHGDVSVGDYIAQGWLPQALLNWLALAGWGSGHDRDNKSVNQKKDKTAAPESTEMFTLIELIKNFELSVLTPRRTILEPKKLEVINKKHIQHTIESDAGLDEMVEKVQNALQTVYPQSSKVAELDLRHILRLTKERIKNVNDIPEQLEFLLWDGRSVGAPVPQVQELLKSQGIRSERFVSVMTKYEELITNTEAHGKQWDDQTIMDVENRREEKDEMVILRIALTAKKTGLPLLHVMVLLGRDETRRRLTAAKELTLLS